MKTEEDILNEKAEQHVRHIIDVRDSIEFGRCIILTGFNGCGKSLIRKQMNYAVERVYPNAKVRQVSMQSRTQANTAFGTLSTALHDDSWEATSCSTFYLIKSLLGTIKDEDKKAYLVLDEPEIGMSRESQLGIAAYLKEKMDEILEHSYGILIITHSEDIVREMKDIADFRNIGYNGISMSADEWLDRKPVPTDFDELDKWTTCLYHYLQKHYGRKNSSAF